jgi:wyosine [tRNA(Phe)-imidazoG37] synthetase (radical SAM superfamily)
VAEAGSRLLSVHEHSRDNAGCAYVYPVISRRAGGVSIGINLNTNNACNWACIYCQVPGLVRGNAPPIDMAVLEAELRALLVAMVHGNWLERHAPEGARLLQDIAFSGNGEPTGCRQLPQALALVRELLEQFGLLGKIKVRLLTNGSLMHRKLVLEAVSALAASNGEVWFKVDRATSAGMMSINQVSGNPAAIRRRLRACAERCPTWIQTSCFNLDGNPPSQQELAAYFDLIREVRDVIAGVHLYGLARPSMQPGAERLSPLPAPLLASWAEEIRRLGVEVNVSH